MKPTRGPGRPPVDADHAPARVNLLLSAPAYDRMQILARRDGVSIPEVIRRKLEQRLADDGADD
jgi:hypothetical protein